MIGTRIVVSIRHLTHNQVVAGSSRAILWQIIGRNFSNPVTSNEVLILTKAINVLNSQVD